MPVRVLVDDGEHGAGLDLVAGVDVQLGDDAGGRGGDAVLHLHRLQPEQGLPGRRPGRPRRASATRTTVPGIGASSEPGAVRPAGSGKRGRAVSVTAPSGEST